MQIEILTHIKIIRPYRKTRTRTDDDRQIHGRLASRQNQKGNQLWRGWGAGGALRDMVWNKARNYRCAIAISATPLQSQQQSSIEDDTGRRKSQARQSKIPRTPIDPTRRGAWPTASLEQRDVTYRRTKPLAASMEPSRAWHSVCTSASKPMPSPLRRPP